MYITEVLHTHCEPIQGVGRRIIPCHELPSLVAVVPPSPLVTLTGHENAPVDAHRVQSTIACIFRSHGTFNSSMYAVWRHRI